MSQVVNINDTLDFTASSYTGQTNIGSESSTYPWSRGYNSVDWTDDFARLQLTSTSTSTNCYIYYVYSISGIPAGATINSVSCSVRIARNNRVGSSTVQLYNGTTAKGSSVTFSSTNTTGTSVTPTNISDTGSWTVSELQNIRLRITGRRTNTNNTGYIYLWGSTLTISYTYQGIKYEIISTLNTDAIDSIDPEGLTLVETGDSYELAIYGNSLDNVKVEDNGNNVTSSLTQHTVIPGGTLNTVLGQYTLISGRFNGSGASYFQGITGKGVNGSTTTSNYYSSGSGTIAVFTYKLIFSEDIPENATITRLYCEVNGHAESTSNNNEYMCVQLRSGNTELSEETNFKSVGTSNSTITLEATTLPTISQLDDLILYCRLGYYGGAINGATCYIVYETPSNNPYYWTYSLTNISDDHTIIVSDAIIEIPDEDPQYNYYSLTVSSINAVTDPGRGTTRIVEGSNQVIEIYPTDPLITLITDNGIDVSNMLVAHGGEIPDPVVSTVSGASYGFNLNSTTGYYVSSNTGISKTAAVCKVDFELPVRCLVTIQFINYAEESYDFGVFGDIDIPLSTSYYSAGSGGATITDSDYKLACSTSSYNTSSPQTLTYEIPAGEHFIYIKYSKDDASDSNNDSLQWKILNIEPLESNNYYTYTLSNIQQNHSLIFIFGDVTYYFVNSSGSNCKLFPSGSFVHLPGDTYQLTVIPDDYSYNIFGTDNSSDITSSLQRVEQEITKDGSTYTVINYTYKITNVQATHNVIITCTPAVSNYIKLHDRWSLITKVYKKIGGTWVQQTDSLEDIIENIGNKIIYGGDLSN